MEAISPWNSLEITKILVSVLTPIVIGVLGIWANRTLRKLERHQRASDRIIQRRIQVYDDVGPRLNDVFCYFAETGHWKDFTPPQILAIKRELDKTMYTYRPLFSKELFELYTKFIDCAFQHFGEPDTDAKLRADPSHRRSVAESVGIEWNPEWDERFTGLDDRIEKKMEVDGHYRVLIDEFASELELRLTDGTLSDRERPR